MAGIAKRSFTSPDEKRTPPQATVEIVRLGGTSIARLTFQPGWRWSEHIKPVVGTDWCQARHVGVVISGALKVVHEDGTEVTTQPGEAYVIEPGHDGWTVGDEPAVMLEFESAEDYAKA